VSEHKPEQGSVASTDERQHIFDNPRNVKRLIRIFFVTAAALLAVDLWFHRHGSFEHSPAEFPQEHWFGFYGVYGFVACVLLVIVAKYVLRKLVMRSEDFYDR
jgi:hypothetical protein